MDAVRLDHCRHVLSDVNALPPSTPAQRMEAGDKTRRVKVHALD
jgi:hypothetical protein